MKAVQSLWIDAQVNDKANASTLFHFRSLMHIFRAISKIPLLYFLYLFRYRKEPSPFFCLGCTASLYSNCFTYAKLEKNYI